MQTRWLRALAGAAFLVVAVASNAMADPVGVSGFYTTQPFGAISSTELTLTFSNFTVNIFDNGFPSALDLIPGFDTDNRLASFTQHTGIFSSHSTASPGSNTIDADVTGQLSFVGPTDPINIPDGDCEFGCGVVLTEPLTWSGFLTIRQGNQLLFNGSLAGTGTATALFGTFPPSQFWQGTDIRFSGGSQTPEPASILLLGSGVAWLTRRRVRSRKAISAS